MFAFLMADDAQLRLSVPLGKADLAEDAVTVEDEPTGVLEAKVALVAMDL